MITPKMARKDLVKYGKLIANKGLVVGPGGNMSQRVGNTVYLKASGVSFEDAKEKDYVGINLKSGKIVDGTSKPSCEILMHLGCYLARDDIMAVVHTHAPISMAVASRGVPLKPLYPDFAALVGKEVPIIRYIIPAGKELADEVVKEIKSNNCILMANHGVLTVGNNLKEAYYRMLLIEEASRTLLASYIFGKVKFLTEEEIEDVDNLKAEDYRKALLKIAR